MKSIITLLFLVLITSCKDAAIKEITLKDGGSTLASEDSEGREDGKTLEKKEASYISERFKAIGLTPKGTDGYFQTFSFNPQTDLGGEVSYGDKTKDSIITGTNVLGYIDNKAKNTIIIGANYDPLSYSGESSYRAKDRSKHHATDDTASGVAVLLNLAVKLRTLNTNNNYVFLAFSGEKMGLMGSDYFIKNPSIDTATANYWIILDLVGRLKLDNTLVVLGTGTSPRFKQVLHAANKNFKLIENGSGIGSSDQKSFYLSDIPVLHFFKGQNEDDQMASDDSEKLNYEGMELVSDLILDVITDLDHSGKLVFTKTEN